MKLKLGKMTSKEIAAWLGLSYNTYRNKIDEYLQRLDPYADYEKVYGGAIIKEIYIDEYDKKLQKNDDVLYLREVMRSKDHLSTLSGMARKFNRDGDLKLSERQVIRRMKQSGERLFGKTQTKTKYKGDCGLMGSKEYIWAVKLGHYNNYRLLTENETKLFNNILVKYYGKDPEKVKKAELLKMQLKKGEITKEEFFQQEEELGLNFFTDCIQRFLEDTGFLIVRATKHDLGLDFSRDLTPEEKAYTEWLAAEVQ